MAEVVSPQSPLGPSDTNEGKGHRAAQETYTCERMSVILWRCWANEGRMYYSSIYENCQLTSPYHIIRISYLINMFIMFSWCPMNTIMRSTYVLQGSSLYNMNGWMMKPSPGWSGNHEPPLSKLHRWCIPLIILNSSQCLANAYAFWTSAYTSPRSSWTLGITQREHLLNSEPNRVYNLQHASTSTSWPIVT